MHEQSANKANDQGPDRDERTIFLSYDSETIQLKSPAIITQQLPDQQQQLRVRVLLFHLFALCFGLSDLHAAPNSQAAAV